jgi:hypothetical protein
VIWGCVVVGGEIVRQFPDMAGVYERLGLGVNVVGLDFREVKTLRTLRRGEDVLIVNALIFSASSRPVIVPPVIVTLLDEKGVPLYEWSVAPAVAELEPGEVIDFETELANAPAEARDVRLTFASPRAQVHIEAEGQ